MVIDLSKTQKEKKTNEEKKKGDLAPGKRVREMCVDSGKGKMESETSIGRGLVLTSRFIDGMSV